MAASRRQTQRQLRFVEEYLLDLNATRAAIRAGYSCGSADKIGSRLVGNSRVADAIGTAIALRAARALVSQDDVIAELAKIAFSDMRASATWGPNGVSVRDSQDVDADAARAIAEVSEKTSTSGHAVGLRLHDKVAALRLLGLHLGMFKVPSNTSGEVWDARSYVILGGQKITF